MSEQRGPALSGRVLAFGLVVLAVGLLVLALMISGSLDPLIGGIAWAIIGFGVFLPIGLFAVKRSRP